MCSRSMSLMLLQNMVAWLKWSSNDAELARTFVPRHFARHVDVSPVTRIS